MKQLSKEQQKQIYKNLLQQQKNKPQNLSKIMVIISLSLNKKKL